MASILVAEDDEAVRDFVTRGLALDGHAVTPARDGSEALHALHGGLSVDLLLADIKMPVMDGIALALAVVRDWPHIPVLLMTGYADQRERAAGLDSLIQGVLNKPFTLQELHQHVRAALGG